MDEYDGRQFVGIDLHRQRSVIVRQSESGEQLSAVRIVNDPVALELQLEQAGADPEVVLEATYGWYWAVDVLQACGARVHLAHPLGVKGFRYRRVKNDVRDAADLADLLRMGRLPEAWIAPRQAREVRGLVRYRAKLVATRSGLKAHIHAVLAKAACRLWCRMCSESPVGNGWQRCHWPPPTPNGSARCWNSSTSSTATKRASPR